MSELAFACFTLNFLNIHSFGWLSVRSHDYETEIPMQQSDDSDVYEDFKAGLKSEESKRRMANSNDPKLCSKKVKIRKIYF